MKNNAGQYDSVITNLTATGIAPHHNRTDEQNQDALLLVTNKLLPRKTRS